MDRLPLKGFAQDKILCPWPNETVAELRKQHPGQTIAAWQRVYANAPCSKFMRRSSWKRSVPHSSDFRFPTLAIPFSLRQLEEAAGDDGKGAAREVITSFYDAKGPFTANEKQAFFERLGRMVPELDFDLTDLTLASPQVLSFAVDTPDPTIYFPWDPLQVLHMIYMTVPLDQIEPKNPDKRQIKVLYFRHAENNRLLRKLVANLEGLDTLKFKWIPVASTETLLTSYISWPGPPEGPKELLPNFMRKLWANLVLTRTWDQQRLSDSKAPAFLAMCQQMHQLGKKNKLRKAYDLYVTPAGTLFLTKEQVAAMEFNGHEVRKFVDKMKAKVGKAALLAQVDLIVGYFAEMAAELPPAQVKKKIAGASTAAVRDMREALHSFTAFATVLLLKDRSLQNHTALQALSLSSLKRALVVTNRSKAKRTGSLKTMNTQTKLKAAVKRLRSDPSSAPPTVWRTFLEDVQSSLPLQVPLTAPSRRYQRDMLRRYKELKMPEVSAKPQGSNCTRRVIDEAFGNGFIDPDNAQRFLTLDFVPSSPVKGKLLVHSVGSGKTCTAVRIACNFARAGYRIVWATKTSLRNQVYKNHVSEICNILLIQAYERVRIREGQAAADQWRRAIPNQTSFNTLITFLGQLGMDWTNMSYRQLTNALAQGNEWGKAWAEQARYRSIKADQVDPLSKTLIIIDEVHKIFTGELDRTEMPDVALLKESLQNSYAMSGDLSARVLFLTATPMSVSPLSLMSMMNMMSPTDVFAFEMATVDPSLTLEDGLLRRDVERVMEENRAREIKLACQMFPQGTALCSSDFQVPGNVQSYFDAKGVIGASTVEGRDLQNNLETFWQQTAGKISYYNISADWSRFPHTEYRSIIMPSATMLQEQLIASALAQVPSNRDGLGKLSRKVRRICAWAIFHRVGSEPKQPGQLDQVIMKANREATFFEPTKEDLLKQIRQMEAMVEEQKKRTYSSEETKNLEYFRTEVKKLKAKLDEVKRQAIELANQPLAEGESKRARSRRKGDLTKKKNSAVRDLNMMTTALNDAENNLDFFQTKKKAKIQYLQAKIARLRTRWRAARPESKEVKREQAAAMKLFFKQLNRSEEVTGDAADSKDDEGEEIVEESSPLILDTEEDEKDAAARHKTEAGVAKKLKGRAYYVKKVWISDTKLGRKQRQYMAQRPVYPKQDYFDQEDTFNPAQFGAKIPLYSPKLAKLLEVINSIDAHDRKVNPGPGAKVRKMMIFCEDLHAIRAVAGGLVSQGWTFGMRRKWVRLRTEYYDSKTDRKITTKTSRASQITWLPDSRRGEDYKRFLVLTRSKMGSLSGASLNDYAIQRIGAKGKDATYNHESNARGKNYRIILIDRNFVEGIDLPSSYAMLFDPVLSSSKREQIVGRISRFCGSRDLPFVKGTGWPQVVYRFGLKFHSVGLHMSSRQLQKFRQIVTKPDSAYNAVIPDARGQVVDKKRGRRRTGAESNPMADGFVEKIESHLFSPVELQVLLNGNMEIQRLRRRSLDVFHALLERVSIGKLLYEPAMANLFKSQAKLQEMLTEEEETERQYKESVFLEDIGRHERQISYNLRSSKQSVNNQYEVGEGLIYATIGRMVRASMKTSRQAKLDEWKTEAKRKRFYMYNVLPLRNDANFITVRPELLRQITDSMIDERYRTMTERLGRRNREREEKERQGSERKRKRKEKAEAKRKLKANKAKAKADFAMIQAARKSMKKDWSQIRKDPNALLVLFEAVAGSMDRATFDALTASSLKMRYSDLTNGRRKQVAAAMKLPEGLDWKQVQADPDKVAEVRSMARSRLPDLTDGEFNLAFAYHLKGPRKRQKGAVAAMNELRKSVANDELRVNGPHFKEPMIKDAMVRWPHLEWSKLEQAWNKAQAKLFKAAPAPSPSARSS